MKDSKKLSFKQRKEISKNIKKNSYFSIGIASVKEIEKIKYFASVFAVNEKSYLNLSKKPEKVLVDGIFKTPKVSYSV